MLNAILPALVSAGSSILGGIMGRNSQREQQQQAYDQQREFAQSGIQWRVEDARRAGIHPLYALGASTHSFAPTSVGGDPMGQGIAQAGQNVGRALMQTQNSTTKHAEALQLLQLERAGLENQMLAKQLSNLNASGPSMPTPGVDNMLTGQGNTPVEDQPMKRTGPGLNPATEPGAISDVGWSRTSDGGYAVVPSKDVKERIEDMTWPELQWFIRNGITPAIGANRSEPFPAPSGKHWIFNAATGVYYLRDNNSFSPFKHIMRDDPYS